MDRRSRVDTRVDLAKTGSDVLGARLDVDAFLAGDDGETSMGAGDADDDADDAGGGSFSWCVAIVVEGAVGGNRDFTAAGASNVVVADCC